MVKTEIAHWLFIFKRLVLPKNRQSAKCASVLPGTLKTNLKSEDGDGGRWWQSSGSTLKIVNLRSGFQSSSQLLSRPELTYFVKCRQKLSGSWIPKNYIQLQREKENFDFACLRSSWKVKFGIKFSLPSSSWYLKLPKIRDHTVGE